MMSPGLMHYFFMKGISIRRETKMRPCESPDFCIIMFLRTFLFPHFPFFPRERPFDFYFSTNVFSE